MFKQYLGNSIYKFFNNIFYDNNTHSIIDPLTCLIRLAMLEFKPINTKLSIKNNRITYNDPNILQGALRWSNGDNRSDIHNIYNPIIKAKASIMSRNLFRCVYIMFVNYKNTFYE